MTQSELAAAAGISRLCLRDLATSKRSVGVANQFKVLNVLGYEMALFIKRSDLDDADIWDTGT